MQITAKPEKRAMKTVLLAMNEVPLSRNMKVLPLTHMQILLTDRDMNTISLKIH